MLPKWSDFCNSFGSEGMYGDALSTSLFIMGPEKAADFPQTHRDFEAIPMTELDELLITPGLADVFQLTEGSPLSVISDC